MADGQVKDVSKYGVFSDTLSLRSTYGWLDFEGINPGEIVDYCNRAFERLAEQFKDKTKLKQLICSYVEECQELETVLQDLKFKRSLLTAKGAQLDIIGEILDVTRDVLFDPADDEEYRRRLIIQTIVYRSAGQPEKIIQLFKELTGASFVKYKEFYPASFQIYTDGYSPDMVRLLNQLRAGGIGFMLNSIRGVTPFWAYSLDGGGSPPDSAGFSDLGTAGKYIERFSV